MRKRLLLTFFVLLVAVASVSANAYQNANRLIKNGCVKSDPDAIKALVPQLTDSEITSLYTWNKVDVFGPVLMNSALGFGSGSLSQKDTVHGLIFLAGDTVFTGMIAWNFLRNAGVNIGNEISGEGGVYDDYTLALAGLIGAAALRIWQGIRAATYANRYNGRLSYALGLDSASVAVMPVIRDEGTGFSVGARIEL